MRKAVLISIKPEWCSLIATGKKTVEVRKTKPKTDMPFKCYIYCTKAPKGWFFMNSPDVRRDGKVIGEFMCKMITPIAYTTDGLADVVDCDTACMGPLDFIKYGKGKPLYAWHISDLKIYDRPKDLSEFLKPCICPKMPYCPTCSVGYEYISETEEEFYEVDGECDTEWVCQNYLKKAPQSWCYVEEREDNG